jgi:hypothetical protein
VRRGTWQDTLEYQKVQNRLPEATLGGRRQQLFGEHIRGAREIFNFLDQVRACVHVCVLLLPPLPRPTAAAAAAAAAAPPLTEAPRPCSGEHRALMSGRGDG